MVEVDLKDLMGKDLERIGTEVVEMDETDLVEKYLEKKDLVGTEIGAAFQGAVE